jgi:hypothetical protein
MPPRINQAAIVNNKARDNVAAEREENERLVGRNDGERDLLLGYAIPPSSQ